LREWAGAGNPSIADQGIAAAAENAKERWWEADIYRVAGEISLLSRNSDMAKAQGISTMLSWSLVSNKRLRRFPCKSTP
jgi:hypothetical protein